MIHDNRGITPTYMGNTLLAVSLPRLVRDHPHIHGEYTKIYENIQEALGSPPHTWGIHVTKPRFDSEKRITPTYMGNTNYWFYRKRLSEDHPHIHGEYIRAPTGQSKSLGNTPHTWGILNFLLKT